MTTAVFQGIALLAMLASLPLFSWGTNAELPAVTVVAAALLAVGAVALTVLRYLHPKEEE